MTLLNSFPYMQCLQMLFLGIPLALLLRILKENHCWLPWVSCLSGWLLYRCLVITYDMSPFLRAVWIQIMGSHCYYVQHMTEEDNSVAHGWSKVMEIDTWFRKGVSLLSCLFNPPLVAENQEHG